MDALNKGRFAIPCASLNMPHCTEFIERKSRFLTQSCHCANAENAREFIAKIKEKWPDATHNCWAFQLGPPGDTAFIGSSDDGEPHGTAGKPILNALVHGAVGQICMVVTRWFGGIKLGTGGLVRAYQQSALNNLVSLPIAESMELLWWKIMADYEHVNNIQRILPFLEANLDKVEYNEKVEFLISIPADRRDDFAREIANATNGRAITHALQG